MSRSFQTGLLSLVLALSALSLGCVPVFLDPSYISEGGRKGAVRDAADSFGHDLRWGRFEQASARLEPDSRDDFRLLASEFEGKVRFTGVEIEAVELGTLKSEASVVVAFTLYRVATIEEVTIRERQVWNFDRVRRAWLLAPDLDFYRAQLPQQQASTR